MSVVTTLFGQVVIGPPGSGKTTYCKAMAEFLKSIGRKVTLVNLDPANDNVPFESDINISELITLEDVMEQLKLGPNGGLIYCLEYLEKNVDWLISKINSFKNSYFIFDLPGQVELYTHHGSVKKIVEALDKFGLRLCAVHLVDSHYCSDQGKFISVVLASLTSMLQLSMPQVNILSKCDLIERYGKLQFGLEFYTEVLDLNYLISALDDDPFTEKYNKLTAKIVDVLESYSYVSFLPLSVDDTKALLKVKNEVDKANGYVYGSGEERNIQSLMSCAVGTEFQAERLGRYQENLS
ncbi:GPN-loop GTPase 2-like [Artemia franciscana]|uniref:GPN-loop GTPase 2 n=1 Tax=Artemia franciscana TaxID=6661 RepID=A0AA88L553_ARTSF|nr:hypothetical protein QYM36_006145 [Artemia franciscana]